MLDRGSSVIQRFVAVIVALAFPLATFSRAADRPPNFILVLADDLGAKELACYGNTEHRTPNLDRIASQGMRFSTCWVTPLCTPTRVALMTGRYGFRTGWNGLFGRANVPKPGDANFDLGAVEVTFADVLKSR